MGVKRQHARHERIDQAMLHRGGRDWAGRETSRIASQRVHHSTRAGLSHQENARPKADGESAPCQCISQTRNRELSRFERREPIVADRGRRYRIAFLSQLMKTVTARTRQAKADFPNQCKRCFA